VNPISPFHRVVGGESWRPPGVSALGVHDSRGAFDGDEAKPAVPSALSLMKAGPTRSMASRSHRSISTIRQLLIDGVRSRSWGGSSCQLDRKERHLLSGQVLGCAADGAVAPGDTERVLWLVEARRGCARRGPPEGTPRLRCPGTAWRERPPRFLATRARVDEDQTVHVGRCCRCPSPGRNALRMNEQDDSSSCGISGFNRPTRYSEDWAR